MLADAEKNLPRQVLQFYCKSTTCALRKTFYNMRSIYSPKHPQKKYVSNKIIIYKTHVLNQPNQPTKPITFFYQNNHISPYTK